MSALLGHTNTAQTGDKFKILTEKYNNLQMWSNDRGFSFERNYVLRRWESETLK